MRESEKKFATAFLKNSIPATITTVDEGRYMEVSEAFLNLMGLNRNEVIGYTSTGVGFITPEQRKIFLNEFTQKGSVVNLELQVRTKGGERRYGLFNSVKISIAAKDYLLTEVTDITDRKQMELAMRESETKSRQIFETMEDLYFDTDAKGIITILSPSLYRLTGWNKEDLIGKPVNTVYVAPDDSMRLLSKFRENGFVNDYELLLKIKDGEVRHTSLTARMILDDNGRSIGVRGVLRDITDRKRAEEEREKLISELQKVLSEVKKLSGLLPICASCKKIRDDKGYWSQIESYIRDHSEAEFSHGICPECTKNLYPDVYKKMIK